MSQFTKEEWDDILRKADDDIIKAKQRYEDTKKEAPSWRVPHYEGGRCYHCDGTGYIGIIFKHKCGACDGHGQTAVYYSPGDPSGWMMEMYNNIGAAMIRKNALLLKRFLDLNPDHPATKAYHAGLLQGSPCDNNLHLLNGKSYDLEGNEVTPIDKARS